MYFITEKTTETGQKFKAIELKAEIATKERKLFCKKYGIVKFRPAHFGACGGISSCIFNKTPDLKVWRLVGDGEYIPKRNSSLGKIIWKEIEKLPIVSNYDLNSCVNELIGRFRRIGFSCNNNQYFGFEINHEWDIKIPSDCKEVTRTEYVKLFDIKKL